MSLPCTNTTIRDIQDLVLGSLAFQNPLSTRLGLCTVSGGHAIICINTKIASLNPMNPTYASDLASLNSLNTSVSSLVQTSPTGPLGFMQAHTDFLSGKLSSFPMSTLQPIIGTLPNVSALAGMTFIGLMGAARAISEVQKGNCTFDPDNPCTGYNAIFSTVLGGLNVTFDAINALLQSICEVEDILGMASQVEAFSLQLVSQIVAEIQALLNFQQTLSAYGVARLLQSMFFAINKTDPCLAAIIDTIATPALNTVLHPPSL